MRMQDVTILGATPPATPVRIFDSLPREDNVRFTNWFARSKFSPTSPDEVPKQIL